MSLSNQSLTKEQKQAVGILSIGTFLEYFDLMLYVHMAVLLNDLFFSKTDSFSASLLSAFSYSVTFIFRPIGGLLIGCIGDRWGRRITVVITSITMSLTCLVMAVLPTFDQVGIIASWAVTLCRIIQGISSMGEKVGAEIYLTEIIKPPLIYPVVTTIKLMNIFGGIFALIVATISLSYGLTWRVAFLIGAVVAFVGIFARKSLRETPDFADANRKMINMCKDFGINKKEVLSKPWCKEKINKKLALSYFLIQLTTPVCIYFVYIHCSNILKYSFNYTSTQIIQHNLIITIIEFLFIGFFAYLLFFIHPFKILKVRLYIALPFILFFPFLLNNIDNILTLMLIQVFMISFMVTDIAGEPIFYKSFPIFKRFTSVCTIFAISRAVMYVISSFGIVYLIKYFGNIGLLFLFVPITMCYSWGLFQFIKHYEREKMEKEGLIGKEISLKEALFNIKTAS